MLGPWHPRRRSALSSYFLAFAWPSLSCWRYWRCNPASGSFWYFCPCVSLNLSVREGCHALTELLHSGAGTKQIREDRHISRWIIFSNKFLQIRNWLLSLVWEGDVLCKLQWNCPEQRILVDSPEGIPVGFSHLLTFSLNSHSLHCSDVNLNGCRRSPFLASWLLLFFPHEYWLPHVIILMTDSIFSNDTKFKQ